MARKTNQTRQMVPEVVSSQKQKHLEFLRMLRKGMEPEALKAEVETAQNDTQPTENRDIQDELEEMFEKLFGPVTNNDEES